MLDEKLKNACVFSEVQRPVTFVITDVRIRAVLFEKKLGYTIKTLDGGDHEPGIAKVIGIVHVPARLKRP